jgi:hypothetical protein
MYPSGKWRGYWEQQVYGRQPMHDLELQFGDGLVTGHGTDIIGAFVFDGSYDTRGNVTLTKKYLGRHSVHYQGVYDGEGTIHGIWTIVPYWQGKFALSLERTTELTTAYAEAPIMEIRPCPAMVPAPVTSDE